MSALQFGGADKRGSVGGGWNDGVGLVRNHRTSIFQIKLVQDRQDVTYNRHMELHSIMAIRIAAHACMRAHACMINVAYEQQTTHAYTLKGTERSVFCN